MRPIRRTRLAFLLAAAAIAAISGCRDDPEPVASGAGGTWSDASPHRTSNVTVNGVRLNVLDWGGTGPALVLIHGLGDSPHVFDDLAPMLTPDFHVVAYARRGHATSGMTGPFDNGTLTNDLTALLDTLGIGRVNLLGWSMGGNEISEFAVRHPERTAGLIYLDAAYDWADPALIRSFEALPVAITPTAADMPSLDALRAWFQITWLPGLAWPDAWEAHLRDLVTTAPDGSVRYWQTDSINGLMFESLTAYRKNYRGISAPALALYAPDFLPVPVGDSLRTARVADWERQYFAAYRRASIERFRREVAAGSDTVLPNTSHASIGVVDVEGVARLIRGFLLGASSNASGAMAGSNGVGRSATRWTRAS